MGAPSGCDVQEGPLSLRTVAFLEFYCRAPPDPQGILAPFELLLCLLTLAADLAFAWSFSF